MCEKSEQVQGAQLTAVKRSDRLSQRERRDMKEQEAVIKK